MFSAIQLADDLQPMGYPDVPDPATRPYSLHATSSAFSSVAAANEDWTLISDLAERRRIQNRIAQRNYRRKLKRRLAELEMRASTSEGMPVASMDVATAPSASSPPRPYRVAKKPRRVPAGHVKWPRDAPLPSLPNLSTLSSLPALPNQLPRQQLASSQRPILLPDPLSEQHHQAQGSQQPPTALGGSNRDEDFMYSSSANSYEDRLDRPESPPPMFSYNHYPAPDHVLLAPYQAPPSSHYSHHPAHHDSQYSSYIPTSVSLHPPTPSGSGPTPSAAPSAASAIKRDPYANSEDRFNPYVGYGYVDMNSSSAYNNGSATLAAMAPPDRSPPAHHAASAREAPPY